ncbi:MAG: hypothetical protein JSV86_16410 [Gemmatimonadota bacterium]|nr:MAG: hypothetical protein JSV86_16410 [Gemmatimonadota bacterium]
MRTSILLCLAAALVALFGCSQDTSVTDPEAGALVFDAPLDLTEDPDGGTCPDVYWETTEELGDGLTLTWTSVLGGFDYTVGQAYNATTTWSLSSSTGPVPSASFVELGERAKGKNTWTPKAKNDPVTGSFDPGTPGDGTLPLTVNMSAMHRGDEDDLDGDGAPDWQGLIGNGHFWLVIELEGFNKSIKMGVNVHLEDPDESFADRCPTGSG